MRKFHDMDVSVRIMEFLLEFHLTFHDAGIFPYIMEGTPLFCIFTESNNPPWRLIVSRARGFSSNCCFVLFCNAALYNRLTADPVSA